ncbi:MAG: Maf family protein [Myxococcota bacterium]|nr:Maf family protein [Myxococcota bacterium]MDW8361538.1 Maf family protein [Myxococcales bacterium]
MTVLAHSLVLGSSSPRRAEILRTLGVPFRLESPRIEEPRAARRSAPAHAIEMACAKLDDVRRRVDPHEVVLAADTVVAVDGDVLGKPVDDDEARRMLACLVGRDHEVWTAVVAARRDDARIGQRIVRTRVRFRPAMPEEIDGYVATGEGRDKAGAYALQGLGMGLVESIDGCWTNVVGLPATQTLSLLREMNVLLRWP